MILTRRAALNGVWLDEVDNRIAISGIEAGSGQESIAAVDAASGYGQRITGRRRSTLDVVIRFRIRAHGLTADGMEERSLVLEKVIAWAADGGVLTLNYKPDRRLNVVLAQIPAEGSLREFASEFSITLRAYTIPYWEQEAANTQTFGGDASSGSRTITVEGSAKTQADVVLANTSGMQINTATVTVGGQAMTFSGLGLNGGESLVIDHSDGLLRIRIRNGNAYRSAMAMRSGANDFMITPGQRSCSFSAQRACRMTVSWRARYL